MLKILFWNLNKKDLRPLVCDAANAESADVVIVIENITTTSEMLKELKANVSGEFHCPEADPARFHLFCRNRELDLSETYAGPRISLRRLRFAGTELTLGIVHLVDKWNWDSSQQATQVQLLAAEISRREEIIGHHRTVLVGDFNMNPFEQSMNLAPGMNAMMTAKCVQSELRTLERVKYRFFYNPMWSLFGDRTPGPAGTYYHTKSSSGHYGWNMLDQVLLRPSAMPWFENVRILTSAGETSVQTESGRPNRRTGSDHFPILVQCKGGDT